MFSNGREGVVRRKEGEAGEQVSWEPRGVSLEEERAVSNTPTCKLHQQRGVFTCQIIRDLFMYLTVMPMLVKVKENGALILFG